MPDRKAPALSGCALLQNVTARAHRTLEAHPLLAALMRDAVREETYSRVLQAFAAYHAMWEPAVFEALETHVGASFLAPRRKLPLIARDLAGLNLPLPEPGRLGPLTLGEALGRFYVQEGATLGGVVIRKHLTRALPSEARNHMAYFKGYGSGTAAMWARSCKEIDRLTARKPVLSAAAAGAQAAFSELGAQIEAMGEAA
ncbi:biliverdin-producing heme oxygenase [Ovoidimarina sediminis]|uniref:biliverdin-producing heme oxygenase n=1 Tax=Ovoidimarina sediminis TaxID=3079856 RepID=UPI00290DED2D|nr:biliverdin-producing heme oxygenase [Rhodophyticola sp. MJ-SS7]MDU8943598.1 biliverdin-producing heme oxygenase [Rhodophyticola sp. MJ-SS7]